MAMIDCTECNAKISSKASACPQCGNPMAESATNELTAAASLQKKRPRLIIFCVASAAIVAGLVAIPVATYTPERAAKYDRELSVDAMCDEMMADSALGEERREARRTCAQIKTSMAAVAAVKHQTMPNGNIATAIKPEFVSLEPLTVILKPENGDQYLHVAMTLQVGNLEQAELIKNNMPRLRARLLLLMSNKKASEVSSVEGKEALTRDIVSAVNQLFGAGFKEGSVQDVLFTSFVIQ